MSLSSTKTINTANFRCKKYKATNSVENVLPEPVQSSFDFALEIYDPCHFVKKLTTKGKKIKNESVIDNHNQHVPEFFPVNLHDLLPEKDKKRYLTIKKVKLRSKINSDSVQQMIELNKPNQDDQLKQQKNTRAEKLEEHIIKCISNKPIEVEKDIIVSDKEVETVVVMPETKSIVIAPPPPGDPLTFL